MRAQRLWGIPTPYAKSAEMKNADDGFPLGKGSLNTRTNSISSQWHVNIEGPHGGWDLIEVKDHVWEQLSGLHVKVGVLKEDQWYLAPKFSPVTYCSSWNSILVDSFTWVLEILAVLKSPCGKASTSGRHYTCKCQRTCKRDGKGEVQVASPHFTDVIVCLMPALIIQEPPLLQCGFI